MVLNKDQLLTVFPLARPLDIYLPYLQDLSQWGITDPKDVAMFLAQTAHESAQFNRISENLNYSEEALLRVFPKYFTRDQASAYARQPTSIANRVYANRMGNGPETSGDGYKYRGRGLIQTTGKNNYQACGQALGIDLVNNPDLLLQPKYAVDSAGYFWQRNGLSKYLGDVTKVTRLINGGTLGLGERAAFYEKVCKVMGIK